VSSGAQVLANARAPEEPDMERIQRLKDAIANGTFVIDHERIAQRMLDEEQ
jgi:flagellar biosynthesis anti-sigma factor FlgM